VAALLALPDPPTAMVVANTAQVHNALRRMSLMGVQIPEELSVVVFDDNPWIELVTPSLSAVHQPIEMLAMHSVELVLGRLRGQLPQGAQTMTVQAEFISRSSCAAPNTSNPSQTRTPPISA
jgi:LacI family transcriptional regulator